MRKLWGLIKLIFDPLILWCFGWKQRRESWAGILRTLWKDPETGHWLIQNAAIIICERRITSQSSKWEKPEQTSNITRTESMKPDKNEKAFIIAEVSSKRIDPRKTVKGVKSIQIPRKRIINEELFQKIAREVESDQGWGGLSTPGYVYYDFAKEVTLRYIKQLLINQSIAYGKSSKNQGTA